MIRLTLGQQPQESPMLYSSIRVEAMQQLLIPHRTGDERLLISGWAGELSDPEVEFIEERLRGSRHLSSQWGITNRDYSEQGIRRVALGGPR